MYTNKTFLAIIPARGGSKRLPRKNILDLCGKPLIAYTIEAALKSKYISKVIVSSDDEEILNIAKEYKADFIKRPDELARDTTPTEPVVEHILQNIKDLGNYSYLVLLQPTSPLRDEKDIDEAISKLIQEKDATALISVKEIDNKILKAFKINNNGYLEGISNNKYPFMRRQDLPKVFMPNGAIYIISINEFLKTKRLFSDNAISYLMNEEKSLDIDTIDDFEKIKNYI